MLLIGFVLSGSAAAHDHGWIGFLIVLLIFAFLAALGIAFAVSTSRALRDTTFLRTTGPLHVEKTSTYHGGYDIVLTVGGVVFPIVNPSIYDMVWGASSGVVDYAKGTHEIIEIRDQDGSVLYRAPSYDALAGTVAEFPITGRAERFLRAARQPSPEPEIVTGEAASVHAYRTMSEVAGVAQLTQSQAEAVAEELANSGYVVVHGERIVVTALGLKHLGSGTSQTNPESR